MARTSASQVQGIIKTDPSISLTPFIDTASMLVDQLLTGDNDQGYTLAELEMIERWLSAHFYAIRDVRLDNERAGPVSRKFQYRVDIGLDQTQYGQAAKTLDVSGQLARYDQQTKEGGGQDVKIGHIGRPEVT